MRDYWLLTKKEGGQGQTTLEREWDGESSTEVFGFSHGKMGILMPFTDLVKQTRGPILKRKLNK